MYVWDHAEIFIMWTCFWKGHISFYLLFLSICVECILILSKNLFYFGKTIKERATEVSKKTKLLFLLICVESILIWFSNIAIQSWLPYCQIFTSSHVCYNEGYKIYNVYTCPHIVSRHHCERIIQHYVGVPFS